jgi:DNA-binding NarL/FixJ family response regulator
MITLILAEDHHIVRQGLKISGRGKDFPVVARRTTDCKRWTWSHSTNRTLVLDLMIPRLHGFEVVHAHQEHPATRARALHARRRFYVVEALRAGAVTS